MTDVHRPSISLCPKLLESANKVAVIDHHRRGEEFVESPVFSYVEPSASSASELIIELIRYNEKQIKIEDRDATLLLAGILVDTNHYRNKTSSRTFDASVFLKDAGADNLVADSFLKEEFEEHALKVKIMSTALVPFTGIVVCKSSEEDIIDRTMLSIVAQDTLQIKGINACFVIGRTDSKQVSVSARSDGSVNVQYLMEKMQCGGHFAAAATQLENKSIDEVNKMLMDILEFYLQESRTERK
jgi:c-di-AMP phosphodiesterase-like protein